jgi:hypothetical protein
MGSGSAIAILAELQPHTLIHSHHTLVMGYLHTCHITLCHTELQLINIYMSINTARATTVANALKKHMETIPLDRKILIGGGWNVTLEAQDREHHLKKRTALAEQLENLAHTHQILAVWRRFHADSNQFKYRGNQATKPKSRLERIYFRQLASLNPLRSDMPMVRRSCRTLLQYTTTHKNNVQPSGDSETCSSMTNPSLTS